MQFKLQSEYKPTGDQPQAIEKLVKGIGIGEKYQTLLGVTGSGKTFTIANVVQEVQRPTIVLAHNKTLAAQLFMEFKEFFPDNAVEYFVSYYDYYQPEAFIASTNTYIEKDLSINEENAVVKVFDGIFGELPLIGILAGYFFNPTYLVTRTNGLPVVLLTKEKSFFGRRFKVDKLAEFSSTGEENRIMLGLMMMILLERQRG